MTDGYTEFEARERDNPICLGGGNTKKEPYIVVCWHCWSRADNPFKYFQGDLADWLKAIGRV
jgi:hypothetical protein